MTTSPFDADRPPETPRRRFDPVRGERRRGNRLDPAAVVRAGAALDQPGLFAAGDQGHHAMLLGLIADSFHALPIGQSLLSQEVYGRILRWSSMMFLGSMLMALPVMISLLFINVGMGVVTRAAPSLNIFAVGFPAMTLGGFLILIVSLPSIGGRMEWLWLQGFQVLRDIMGLSHV